MTGPGHIYMFAWPSEIHACRGNFSYPFERRIINIYIAHTALTLSGTGSCFRNNRKLLVEFYFSSPAQFSSKSFKINYRFIIIENTLFSSPIKYILPYFLAVCHTEAISRLCWLAPRQEHSVSTRDADPHPHSPPGATSSLEPFTVLAC